MTSSRAKWHLITAFATVCCVGIAAAAFSQFTSFNDRTHAMLEGNRQSCREGDGEYAERIYDGKVPGLGPFELHMGPYNELALFRGVQEEHRDHASGLNLLRPYKVELSGTLARHTWTVSGLTLEVNLAGGSREDCESWFISLRRTDSLSSN